MTPLLSITSRRATRYLLVAAGAAAACSRPAQTPAAGSKVVVYAAGSLARPLHVAMDSLAAATGVTFELEAAGSLETARKLTELGKIPDVIALADEEVFPQLLMPDHVTWYARFARNRMVLAKGAKARFGAEINGDNWWKVIQRPGLEVGRSDPDLDPAGYRTLLLFQLAESALQTPGLARALERSAPRRNMRAKSAELVALLQTGEIDYAWEYESVARAARLDFVALGGAIDLGSDADSARYAAASVRVRGRRPGDTLEVRGRPINYALSIPPNAPNPAAAGQLVQFLFSEKGRRLMRSQYLDVLDMPAFVGSGIPTVLDSVRLGSVPRTAYIPEDRRTSPTFLRATP
jgi:molybdate/tungstate transport system substrate-binding protein